MNTVQLPTILTWLQSPLDRRTEVWELCDKTQIRAAKAVMNLRLQNQARRAGFYQATERGR